MHSCFPAFAVNCEIGQHLNMSKFLTSCQSNLFEKVAQRVTSNKI